MKKLILLCALCAGIAVPAFAQNYEDVVHLKNGSIIKGTIVEQVPNESLKIQTREGNLFVYKMDEVQKMAKEISTVSRGGANRAKGQFNKPKGYMGLAELGFGFGVGDQAATRYSLTMVNGYRFLPQFAVGLGVGVEQFAYEIIRTGEKKTETAIPVFLHLRSDFINGKVSPFVAFNAGYNIAMDGEDSRFKGMMLEPVLGVSFNIGEKNRMVIGASYKMNRVEYKRESGYNNGSYYIDTSRMEKGTGSAINLKVGISF